MPLIQKIARYLWFDVPVEDTATYDVGILGNSRVRAVARYGKTGFEVSWQIVPASVNGDVARTDRFVTARLRLKNLNLAASGRVAKGQVA